MRILCLNRSEPIDQTKIQLWYYWSLYGVVVSTWFGLVSESPLVSWIGMHSQLSDQSEIIGLMLLVWKSGFKQNIYIYFFYTCVVRCQTNHICSDFIRYVESLPWKHMHFNSHTTVFIWLFWYDRKSVVVHIHPTRIQLRLIAQACSVSTQHCL